MINIGKYIEMAINWLTENFAGLFDVINHIVGGFIDGFQGILMWVPFYLARFTFDLGDGVLGTDHADCGACLVVDDHRLVVRCPAGNLDRAKR